MQGTTIPTRIREKTSPKQARCGADGNNARPAAGGGYCRTPSQTRDQGTWAGVFVEMSARERKVGMGNLDTLRLLPTGLRLALF